VRFLLEDASAGDLRCLKRNMSNYSSKPYTDSDPHFFSDLLSFREAWDTRYRVRGRQWGNAPVEFAEISSFGVVLELGVGDGKNIRARHMSGSYTIGLDFSLEALRLCRFDPTLCDCDFIAADGCILPIRDNSVNLVFAHHILGHIPACNLSSLIHEVHRVLALEGRFFVTVFAKGDMRDGSGYEVEPSAYVRGDGIMTRYFQIDEMKRLFNKFFISDIRQEEWQMKIRGRNYPRMIITTELIKT